jgi:hypothetical protein
MKAVCGAMPRTAGGGAMPQNGDGVVIGVTKALAMSRGGCCARRRGHRRCDDIVHDKIVAALRWHRQVVADSPQLKIGESRLGG